MALSFVSLGVVCLVAYGVLKWLGRRGVGKSTGPLRVVARCPLEPKRAVYLIEAAGRFFLVGVGDGPMALLAELDRGQVLGGEAEAVSPTPGFAATLAGVLKR